MNTIIRLKAIPCLISLIFLLCWALPMSTAEQVANHPTIHQAEHSGEENEKGTVHSTGHSEHASHPTIHQVEHSGEENEKGAVHSTGHSEHASHEQENPGNHSTDTHHHPAPQIYYLYWFLLVLTFGIVCFYCLWVHKRGKPEHEGLSLAIILVLLVIVLYAVNQLPELQRHFDLTSRHFVDGYHESTTGGFVKFLYKIMLGILLMIYGLMGKEHH